MDGGLLVVPQAWSRVYRPMGCTEAGRFRPILPIGADLIRVRPRSRVQAQVADRAELGRAWQDSGLVFTTRTYWSTASSLVVERVVESNPTHRARARGNGGPLLPSPSCKTPPATPVAYCAGTSPDQPPSSVTSPLLSAPGGCEDRHGRGVAYQMGDERARIH